MKWTLWVLLSCFIVVAHQYTSSMVVYVFPTASYSMFVSCWTNSTTQPFLQSNEFTVTGEISWFIETNPRTAAFYDAYWCRARMGSNILIRFPVYGDGMLKNSSEWILNSRGRRRLSVSGNYLDDQRGSWIVT